MTQDNSSLDQRCINTIRFLCVDAIQKANSGHPGLPMGAAPMTYALWDRFLRFNPKNPKWFNRDRFVLSAGHGSSLQYALLHLTGFDSISIEDLKTFRQWGSAAAGHPENHLTAGIEVTTGPLGQGIANAVGMAIAERHMAARFNKPKFDVIDHTIYTMMGDGCHMEGISSEACSLAGHLGLGNLVALYDDNQITIDGPTDISFSENVGQRFEAYGWHVQVVEDGNTDVEGIAKAIATAKAETSRPSLICVRTTIGFGSPNKAGTSDTHGAPLGDEEIKATRKNLGWTEGPFSVPEDVLNHMRMAVDRGAKAETAWNKLFAEYKVKYQAEAAELEMLLSGELPAGWDAGLPSFTADDKAMATRGLSGMCLNAIAPRLPGLIGGSADLAPSNKTYIKISEYMSKTAMDQRNMYFGVREHAMGAICNGMALHGSGLIPYCATFLVFADYMRGAMRVAALSNAGVIHIMTHDSVAVGEDGPTHQPVEQLASLRAIPSLLVLRPADGNESTGAYRVAISNRNRPSVLAFSRQGLPQLAGTSSEGVAKGGYIVSDSDGTPELILIGTGGELHLCTSAAETLRSEGHKVRVVSLPSFELFEEQDAAYRESVLPAAITRRLAVEAGSSFGWDRYANASVTIDRFGASAPGNVCLEKFGFTTANVLAKARELL
jgi:transketolase